MGDGMKVCMVCDGIKARKEFATLYIKTGELAGICRKCMSLKHKCHKHGITVEEYFGMIKKQKGLCKICGNPPQSKGLCIDHDHKAGGVRGLLCFNCNMMLGFAKDNADVLLAAAQYLKKRPVLKGTNGCQREKGKFRKQS